MVKNVHCGPMWSCRFHLTVTLHPSMYRYKPIVQYTQTMTKLHQLFPRNDWQVSMVPELTQNYNIHWHCMISKKYRPNMKPVPYYVANKLRTQKTMFGYFKCDVIEDESKYIDYMLKDIRSTCEILKLNGVVLERDDFELVPTVLESGTFNALSAIYNE